MSSPILCHVFNKPLPYKATLDLQQGLHALQLTRRRNDGGHPDILLILQHRPVFTAGRRQVNTPDLLKEEKRLQLLGADWQYTQRGGETTYHGPGQIVGYPLLDLGRMNV
jgi:lipoyl(octanoyl) transferase 2